MPDGNFTIDVELTDGKQIVYRTILIAIHNIRGSDVVFIPPEITPPEVDLNNQTDVDLVYITNVSLSGTPTQVDENDNTNATNTTVEEQAQKII